MTREPGARDHPGMTRAASVVRARPDRTEATRRRLLEAALKVVGRHGYAGTSIGRITRRARVALGTFYTHFASQQDLFDQLLPHLGEQLLGRIRARVSGIGDTARREAVGFDAFFEFLADYPEFYRVLNEAEIFAPKAHSAHVGNMLQGYLRAFSHARGRGELGEFDPDEFEPVIYMLMGARQYLAMRYPARGGGEVSLPAHARSAYLKVFNRGLLAPVVAEPRDAAPSPTVSRVSGVRRVGRGDSSSLRATLAEPGVSRPALIAAMDELAVLLLPEARAMARWSDVHLQTAFAEEPAPLNGGRRESADASPLRLSAAWRAAGELIEVCAHDPQGRLRAICTFRPSRPVSVSNP